MGRKRTIWERVESAEAFLERKTQGNIKKAKVAKNPMVKIGHGYPTPNETSQSTLRKEKESKPVRNNSNTKPEIPLVNIADESSEEEDDRKYPQTLIDILEHYDFATGEQALDFPFKDVTTISVRRAKELKRQNPHLQGENNVLDSILEPRADVSSLSSHSAAARRLARSMPNIEDKVLQKLVGRASDAHLGIVKHLSERRSQTENVEMITPPGSPKPSTSREDYQRNERRPVSKKGSVGRTRKVTIAPPISVREVVVVTSEDEQYKSSEDNSNRDPENDVPDRPSMEQVNEDEADELDRDSDDGDETTLVITSASENDFDDEFTEDA